MIKLILTIWHSKRDNAGNVYWAFRAVDPLTAKSCEGTISGGESNILAAAQYLVGTSPGYHYSIVELGKRDFKKLTAPFGYAGCNHESQIARFIKEGLGWQIEREVYTIIASRPAVAGREGNGFVHYVSTLDKPASIARTFRIHLDREYAVGTKIQVTDQCFEENGASWSREVPKGTKLFKIAAISSNANAFCLYGHILVALDGETWEVCRAKGEWLDTWNVGTIIEANPNGQFAWANHSVEIPHQKDNAPAKVVRELWGI